MAEASPSWAEAVLEGLLGARSRAAVVTWLCAHPDDPIHTRELARRCGLSPNQTHQQLRRLERIGLVRSQLVGRSRVYDVDPDFPLLPELRRIVLKTTGLAGRLQEALRELPIDVAFIFGSLARGDDQRASDVDLMVVGEVSGRALAAATGPIQGETGRPINAVLYRRAEFQRKVRAHDGLVQAALGGPIVFVRGDRDALRQAAG